MADWRDVSVWQRLAETPEAVSAAAAVDSREPAAIARLRRQFDADLVSAALELAEARRKAFGKFDSPATLWCDVQGVEQASGSPVARWKAQRMRDRLGLSAEIVDLCCGIGGDAIEIARAGLSVRAVDLEPRRAWMAARNAGCESVVADAESIDPAGLAVHVDPARRDESAGQRSWSLASHRPGPAWIDQSLRTAQAAAVKFSPGVDRRSFGDIPIEWEFIEERGTLVQAVAWSGGFARAAGCTRATRISAQVDTQPVTLVGVPDDSRADRIGVADQLPTGHFLSEPYAALERAQLLTEAAGGAAVELARGLGLLVSRTPLTDAWFESFEIVAESVAREDAIRSELSAHGLRARSVRVRGRAADADALTKALGARPDGNSVVFIFRRAAHATAVIARIL
jgi:SAM-dependent methyltransferase